MNQFLEACGATSALQITVDAPGASTREVHSFELPFVIVGRDPGADLRLNHPEVSERHGYFQLIDGRLLFVDLGSRLGIQQSGKRRRLGLVQPEPPTRIGPYRLRWIGGDSQGNEADDADSESPYIADALMAKTHAEDSATHTADALVLQLSHRSARQTRLVVRGGIALVGSGADCNVRLIDPSVSSYHCALVQTKAGTWLVDLLGKGGIKVNRQAVNHARLFEGDEAQIGSSAFRVEALPAPVREAGRLGYARSANRNQGPSPEPVSVSAPAAPILQAVNSDIPATPSAPVSASKSAPNRPPQASHATLLALTELQESPSQTPRALNTTTKELAVDTPPAPTETGLSVAQTAEIVERVVAPLLEQMSMMRRQMLEEFHQARVMMFETIGTLQEEQTAIFNGELEQLRGLSKELEIHRRDLELQTDRLVESAIQGDPYPVPTLHPEPIEAMPMPMPMHFIAATVEPEVSIVPPPPIFNGNGHVNGNGHNGVYRVPNRPHDEQIHAALCDRITRLKEDHQTRWQKLLGIFPGTATGKT